MSFIRLLLVSRVVNSNMVELCVDRKLVRRKLQSSDEDTPRLSNSLRLSSYVVINPGKVELCVDRKLVRRKLQSSDEDAPRLSGFRDRELMQR